MFDLFSWSHILILLGVALIVVGPKDLPKLMNMMGKWAGKARAMANEFKKSFDDMARQSELDELRKEISDLKAHQSISDLGAELNESLDLGSLNAGLDEDAGYAAPPVPKPELDIGPEPRSGEFQITDAAPPHMPASS